MNKRGKTPDVELRVRDPYDELLSMILDGSSGTDDGDILRLPPVDSPPAKPTTESQSRWLQLKAKESHQPAVAPASDSTGSARLEVQFHKPVTMEMRSVLLEEQSKTVKEQLFECQTPPSVKLKGYTELFIEEEDEDIKDTEEDVRVLNERLSPQVEHGVMIQGSGRDIEEKKNMTFELFCQ